MKNIEKESQSEILNLISKEEILSDFKLAYLNRQMAIIGRKEVLLGRAKFGVFGDGKEVAQIAYAKQFQNGDWRSGYYRDNIFMLATGMSSPLEFFAQLFGDTDIKNNPSNGGRSFNNHFATRISNKDGTLKSLTSQKNSAADLSPTAGQMPRLLGLAYASKLFRNNKSLKEYKDLSINGNEVAFGTIGDGATAEGHFFETINAAGVLQVPLAIAIWDDGYGISVPTDLQVIKGSTSDVLKGFEKENGTNGILIFKEKGWDYPAMVKTFKNGIEICRNQHIPVVFHITELTQPSGHSTSGSHERYKSKKRLEWEKQWDALKKMEEWILSENIARVEELQIIKNEAENELKKAKKEAFENFSKPLIADKSEIVNIIKLKNCQCSPNNEDVIEKLVSKLDKNNYPIRTDNFSIAKKILRNICIDCKSNGELKNKLIQWTKENRKINYERYNSLNYSESEYSAFNVKEIKPNYNENANLINGREILRDNFNKLFEKYPLLLTFGEDTGKLGDVNMGMEGLQEKYGDLRVTDTGIREATIIGQGIGLALRGLRPIAEIQYLDYILYGLQPLSDDLACLHYRTAGGQSAPLIIRTRGHRLEGIWHSGSPMSMLIGSLRGIYICVPRNFTQAAGFYNTLLEGNDPGLVIEPLNAYNLKEKEPKNLGEFKIPLGIPEVLEEGNDITLVTYGSCVNIAKEAVKQLKNFDISVELIDVQTLLPFDRNGTIVNSIQKTNKIVFLDEDVPGGATAYMMQQVLDKQDGWKYLDAKPKTLSAKEHRPAYSTDGDYFSNPNAEDVFEVIYEIMHEYDPKKYRSIFG